MFILNENVASFWEYHAASGGIVDTTSTAIKTSDANACNLLTSAQIINVHATVGTEFLILRGAIVLHRLYLPALMITPIAINFNPPLSTDYAQAMNVQCVTTGAAVYFNGQGFTGGRTHN